MSPFEDFVEELSLASVLLFEGVIAEVVDEEQLWGCVALDPLSKRAVGESGMKVEHHVGTGGVEDTPLLAAGDDAESFCDVAFSDARVTDEDEVLMAVNPSEQGEVEDKGLIELGLKGEVEGVEGGSIGEVGIVEAASDTALAAIIELGAQEPLDGFEGLSAPRFVGRKKLGEHGERALHAKGFEQGASAAFDITRHQSSGSLGGGASASA